MEKRLMVLTMANPGMSLATHYIGELVEENDSVVLLKNVVRCVELAVS